LILRLARFLLFALSFAHTRLLRILELILKGRLGSKTGLFNANAPLLSDLNLLFQIAIFVFLVVGLLVVKLRHRFIKHSALMGVAVAFNTVSIAVVMTPSLLGFGDLASTPFTHPAWVVIIHAITGSLVEILGIWLVGTWAFNRHNTETCAKRRNIMRATIFLWLLELLLGAYVYIILYMPA
jgi:uncharacterized membrane protein YozB (DUF420 family)